MTREEEIINAAREYNNGITFSNPSNVLHFEAGAKWADKHPNLESLWHDASEEPNLEEPNLIDSILIQFVGGRCGVYTIRIKAQADLWHAWCKEYEVLRWAYVKDLLPKGGEQ